MAIRRMNKLAILAKIETVSGTDASPTGANAILISDVTLTPLDGDEVQRNNIRPYYGNAGSVLVSTFSKVAFSVEYAGSGTPGTAPKWASLMRACAASVTTSSSTATFVPVSDNVESVTIYANIDGTLHAMPMARGSFKLAADAKSIPKLQFEFTGMFTPVSAAVLPAVDTSGFQAPLGINKANTTLDLHGVSIGVSAFSFDAGVTVIKRDLVNVDSVEVTARSASASVTFDNTDLATKDWIAACRANAEGPIKLVHGKTAGNILELSAPLAQLGKPSFSDKDGIQQITIPLALKPSTAGNDEWAIVSK